MHPIREATVSTRWLIPFLRASGQITAELDLLAREGITLRELADPEARISHRAAVDLMGAAAARLRAPELGLMAAELIAPADFDSLELALRACANLREALTLFGRCMGLVHGAQEAHLSE
ncbi:MAG TPA: AraC family transcriptional regulator ligand-binding domain-containing protein, partial [Polyangiales bacterium]